MVSAKSGGGCFCGSPRENRTGGSFDSGDQIGKDRVQSGEGVMAKRCQVGIEHGVRFILAGAATLVTTITILVYKAGS